MLEQLCRYTTRPALANNRVQCNAGQVVLKLQTLCVNGQYRITRHHEPLLDFLRRIGALSEKKRKAILRASGPEASEYACFGAPPLQA